MKSLLFAIIVTIAVLSSPALVTGCKSTPEDIAFKAVATVDLTATEAMKGWLDYKNTHTVPPEQIAAVKNVWDKFYAANQEARLAAIDFKNGTDTNGVSRAVSAASTASSAVIAIVLKFLPPDKAAALKGVKP